MTARPAGHRRLRGRDAGLTLVELMITLIVASAVASSTFVFFAGQQRIYDTQTKLLNVQQNLWMSMEVMARQLRTSGTGMVGCSPIRAYHEDVGTFSLTPIGITNGVNGAPDQISVSFFANATGNWSDASITDTITTSYNGSPIKTQTPEVFREGEFILLFDIRPNPPGGDRGCTMYQVTGVSNNIIVNPSSPFNMSGQTPPGFVPYDYTPANTGIRSMGTLTSVRYFIDATGAPDRPPRLMIDDMVSADPPQILAEGIEDMQISYACDTQPVGNLDGNLSEGTDAASRLADEWTFNQAGDVPPPGCGVPSAIRITLLGRSLTPETALIGTSGAGAATNSLKAAVEDGLAGAPDAFRHRTLTTTVYPRN